MKKMLMIFMAVALVAAMSIPAAAMENEFGGYWRTRAQGMQDMNDTLEGSTSYVDTRTRLYYTAIFNENLKFVNKFEFDSVFGDNVAGDIGSDGNNFEFKNSYLDFTLGDVNTKVGIQAGKIARGFLFNADFSGVTLTYKNDTMSLPFIWAKASDKDAGAGTERDYLALSPILNINETLSVNPYIILDKEQRTEREIFYVGADVNAKAGDADIWCTAIYETGESPNGPPVTKIEDNAAYLVAFGAKAAPVHGQFFYASGDDDASDDKNNAFLGPDGREYYWSEIMGLGIFDLGDVTSNNSPNDDISNVMAFNVGVTVEPMDKLTFTADLWYAQLAEDKMVNGSMENELGIEVDLIATYALMDNLKLDVVAAYLLAGDATGEDNPIEIGTQLSLSF